MFKKLFGFAAIFAIVFSVASSSRAEDFDDPFLDDFDYYDGDDMLDGDISDGSAGIDLLATPERFALNAGTSFVAVNDFDISGIMLGMPFESVRILFFREAAVYSPASKNSITYSIPKDWRYNLDYECRLQKMVAPKELEKCINTSARKRGFLYPSEIKLERKSTGEKITVNFTSNATNNVVWKISYSNDVNELPGDDEKFSNQREKKILSFWQMILEKYGAPNSGGDRWVSSDNPFDPFMTAGYGELILVDNFLKGEDEVDNIDDSRERFRSKPYSF
jgi:hypothetical protein